MGFNNIEKKDFWYTLLKKKYINLTHNKLFYRKVTIINAEKIPRNSPVIFTPNHQNALMDALALLCNIDRQLVYLARSDIFKKKTIAAILYFFKILPIFRIRDGYSSIKKNKDIFQKTIDVIRSGSGLVILPEGNHQRIHRLRQLKKGFARIAFQTEEASNFNLDLKIVPVGLYYSNYEKTQSDLIIQFGEPISVSNYISLYKEAPAKAINQITNDLYKEIKALVIHIESEEFYQLYDVLRIGFHEKIESDLEISTKQPQNVISSGQQLVSIIEKLEKNKPDKFNDLRINFSELETILNEKRLDQEIFLKGSYSKPKLFKQLVLLILGLPIFIFGIINHLLPFATIKVLNKKIKDPQFTSSFKYVSSIVLVAVFYLIIAIIAFFIIDKWWVWALFLISLPATGLFVLKYRALFSAFRKNWKIIFFKLSKPNQFKKALEIKIKIESIIMNGFNNSST